MKHAALAALAALTGCTRAEPETFLLPSGFVGPVYVVYDRPDGEPEQREDGRRLYTIPSDGLLLSQFGPNDGTVDQRFYFVDPSGARREITGRSTSTIPDTPQSRADTTVVVHDSVVGNLGPSVSAQSPDAGSGTDSTEARVPYQSHVIGTRAQILGGRGRSSGDVMDALARRGVVIE